MVAPGLEAAKSGSRDHTLNHCAVHSCVVTSASQTRLRLFVLPGMLFFLVFTLLNSSSSFRTDLQPSSHKKPS